jgi:hypothetical protein
MDALVRVAPRRDPTYVSPEIITGTHSLKHPSQSSTQCPSTRHIYTYRHPVPCTFWTGCGRSTSAPTTTPSCNGRPTWATTTGSTSSSTWRCSSCCRRACTPSTSTVSGRTGRRASPAPRSCCTSCMRFRRLLRRLCALTMLLTGILLCILLRTSGCLCLVSTGRILRYVSGRLSDCLNIG